MHVGIHSHQTTEYPMQALNSEVILSKLNELCPEIKQLHIQPVVMSKGNRY